VSSVGHPFQFAVCNSWWCFNLFRIYCSVGFCIQCDAALSQDLCVCIWLVVPTSMSCIQEASTSDLDAPCYCFMVFNYAAPAARKWVPTRLFVRQNNTTPCLNLCWAFFNTTHNFACSLLPARSQTELRSFTKVPVSYTVYWTHLQSRDFQLCLPKNTGDGQ